ncbi:uncharacterized protein [Chironomus tepperi]|uniref:uncharacterized protein n=1 Tax=Chironomus tepperi TaxID=113505 RepID=UPI00391F6D97
MATNKIFVIIVLSLLAAPLISTFKLDSNVNIKAQENVLFKEFGIINEESDLLRDDEFAEDGWDGDIVTSFASRGFLSVLTGIRVYQVNNTRGNIIIHAGGINFQQVQFQFFGGGIGEGYAFFVEYYTTPGATLGPTESTTEVITTSETSTLPSTSQPVTSETVIGIITESSVLTYSAEMTEVAEPGQTFNTFNEITLYGTIIHGIRISGLGSNTGLFAIYDGGLNHDYVIIRFYNFVPGQGFSFFIEIYQNGEETTLEPIDTTTNEINTTTDEIETTTESQTEAPTTTEVPTPTTTELPEKRIKEWGVINDDSVLLEERRFHNYLSTGLPATGNGTLEISKLILGMRLTSLNYTDGFANLTSGGVNYTFVNFDFKGTDVAKAYDFNLELFGNSAVTKSLSVVLVLIFNVVIYFFK